jgi:hypothetical protein
MSSVRRRHAPAPDATGVVTGNLVAAVNVGAGKRATSVRSRRYIEIIQRRGKTRVRTHDEQRRDGDGRSDRS